MKHNAILITGATGLIGSYLVSILQMQEKISSQHLDPLIS